jgi:hypothetical protein
MQSALFNKLKQQAKHQGYSELLDYLTNYTNGVETRLDGRPSKHIDSMPYHTALLDASLHNKPTPNINEKTVCKQARDLGVKVRYNDIGSMNLGSYC